MRINTIVIASVYVFRSIEYVPMSSKLLLIQTWLVTTSSKLEIMNKKCQFNTTESNTQKIRASQ